MGVARVFEATVVVPTYDHGPTLRHSVGSALRQTVDDIEVLIVGDGMPDDAREVALELERSDERVRVLVNPKGESRGELHRHAALGEARGRLVFYLSDDDLWFPDHVESMTASLAAAGADFVHAPPIWRMDDGSH
jgi:GalNAc5-diNAcBac-PP-undecaprenol beta-1,3-glucosyltransferase